MESTATYWIPVYTVLEDTPIKVILGNARQIKSIPGKKTDVRDSEWIAQLTLNNLIKPSRIFSREEREVRELTRMRLRLLNNRSQMKNRITKVLDTYSIRLGSVFSNMYGKSGIEVLKGLLDGKTIDEILSESGNAWIHKKKKELKEAIRGVLNPFSIYGIKELLDIVETLNKKIDSLDALISERIQSRRREMEIAMSIHGIGPILAATILTEIGDYRDFSTPGQLASWAGIVPSVYQSGGKTNTGSITKQGSRQLRWALTEAAWSSIRVRDNPLRKTFDRIKCKKGGKIAITAVARKILCILHHLLINDELFENRKPKRMPKSSQSVPRMNLDEMIHTLTKAGYVIRNPETQSGG